MAIAEHARNLPRISAALPNDQKLRDTLAFAGGYLAKAVLPFLNRAKAIDWIDFESSSDRLSMYLSANVFSRIGNHRRAIEGGSALVVIKLDGGRKIAAKGSKITPIICREHFLIHGHDSFRKTRVISDVLCRGSRTTERHYKQRHSRRSKCAN